LYDGVQIEMAGYSTLNSVKDVLVSNISKPGIRVSGVT